MSVHPRDFINEYVAPAMYLYLEHYSAKHLAVHAMTQMDNMAEVVFLWCRVNDPVVMPDATVDAYRKDLRKAYPVLGIIHDARDCHKHGQLDRKSAHDAKGIASRQPPETKAKAGFSPSINIYGGSPNIYNVINIMINDVTESCVYYLLYESKKVWEHELARLGL